MLRTLRVILDFLHRRQRQFFPFLQFNSLMSFFLLFCITFCAVQTASLVFFNQHVTTIGTSLNQATHLREQLALLEKARIELLNASDNSHRAGIYLMQDKQSGSVDSWKSLAATARQSLSNAQGLFEQYHAAPDSPLAQGFTLLSGGLQEQLSGIEKNDTDVFFMVPMQAFQQQFNSAWLNELTTYNQDLTLANQVTLQLLGQSRNTAVFITLILIALLLTDSVLMVRGLLIPLRQANASLNKIAKGNLME
ncbi:MAG: hypothetical protein XXXJIFNMEKO3_01620 [Candidatus Erwinia impunctatus]|nr:hypothetical protein XXXJIFNMEKO_01620 [Culicoides impunctatus]